MFKYGDKVKIYLDSWLDNTKELELEDACGYYLGDVEYSYSLHVDDRGLIEYLFENNTFTINTIDKIKSRGGTIKTIITLKELDDFDFEYVFSEEDLKKV